MRTSLINLGVGNGCSQGCSYGPRSVGMGVCLDWPCTLSLTPVGSQAAGAVTWGCGPRCLTTLEDAGPPFPTVPFSCPPSAIRACRCKILTYHSRTSAQPVRHSNRLQSTPYYRDSTRMVCFKICESHDLHRLLRHFQSDPCGWTASYLLCVMLLFRRLLLLLLLPADDYVSTGVVAVGGASNAPLHGTAKTQIRGQRYQARSRQWPRPHLNLRLRSNIFPGPTVPQRYFKQDRTGCNHALMSLSPSHLLPSFCSAAALSLVPRRMTTVSKVKVRAWTVSSG